jgi:Zn-dependent peptidase ImmA (M78 family)
MRRTQVSLKQSRLSEIRRLTTSLLEKIGWRSGSVPVEDIASLLDLPVKFAPYLNGDLAGMLIVHPTPMIAINSAHHRNRQRFTIAHEIGHFLLHSKEDIHIDKRMQVLYRDGNSSLAVDTQEVEANYFAAELLMPRIALLNDLSVKPLDVEDDDQLAELAKQYGVSQQAMAFRIANILTSIRR